MRSSWRGAACLRSCTGGGVSRRIEVSVEICVSPWNGRSPVIIS
jgi:hypothetical protein